jgi:conjugal transfer/type IV secretion protein DotA/TraY
MIASNNQSALSISKSVAAYALLPGFWSRFVGFMPRFGLIAYLMAIIFESVKLLPRGHRFTHPSQIGQYRVRDVLALAANNLHGGFKNSDQYIIFGMFLLGTALLVLQFVFLFAMIATRTADAAIPFVGIFITVNTETDIAHLLLDKVFGIPQFFNSCFDPMINGNSVCAGYHASTTFPDPLQSAMQQLFQFYSFGILTVAGFVVFYYIIAMVLETANTGVPFGKRFQSIFTPIRLVLAIILLLPLAYGYNTGQYIVLLAAKYGSALATNSWLLFNSNAGENPMGMTSNELIGKPKVGDIDTVLNFLYLAQTCRASYQLGVADDFKTSSSGSSGATGVVIEPYLVLPGTSTATSTSQQLSSGTTYDVAKSYYGQGDVQIVFGQKDNSFVDYPGKVRPYCGIIAMPALSKDITGIKDIYNIYFKNVLDIWFDQDVVAYGTRMACVNKFSSVAGCKSLPSVSTTWDAEDDMVAGQQFYIGMRLLAQGNFKGQLDAQIATMRGTTIPEISMDVKTLQMGWGGAGLWFNKIMSFNGAMVDALGALPTPIQYPLVMEHIAKKKRELTPNAPQTDVFSMTLANGDKNQSMDQYMGEAGLGGSLSQNVEVAGALNPTYKQIQESQATTGPRTGNTDSPIKNFTTLLFGQTGIFDFHGNGEVFPLAKLSMLGRELINRTVIMIASRTVMSAMGGTIGANLGPLGDLIKGVGPALGTFATIGFSIGILLYYVVPLMPFIYFFFAVGRWVKSIFEAMVAVPLWALAHLRLGGEGIPGPAAGAGYFLILEIFLRPILTLFGLVASIVIFMALSNGLDTVFNLAVMNAGGYDMTTLSGGGTDPFMSTARDGMDALFYTVIYAMLIYIIATGSFKLIDLIPNGMMRWAGTNTASFNDQTDPMKEVNYYTVYKADEIARKIDKQNQGISDVGDSIADMQVTKDRLKF